MVDDEKGVNMQQSSDRPIAAAMTEAFFPDQGVAVASTIIKSSLEIEIDTHLRARQPVRVRPPCRITQAVFAYEESDGRPGAPAEWLKELVKIINKYIKPNGIPVTYKDFLRIEINDSEFLERDFFTQKMVDINGGIIKIAILRHTEFFTVKFFYHEPVEKDDSSPLSVQDNDWSAVPRVFNDWLAAFPCNALAAYAHIRVRTHNPSDEFQKLVCDSFDIHESVHSGSLEDIAGPRLEDVIGAKVSFGGAYVAAIIRVRGRELNNGSLFLVEDILLDPTRLGRLIRRLCQFHAYLIVGMATFSAAREQLRTTQIKQSDLNRVLNDQRVGNRSKQKVINELGSYVAEITAKTRHKFNGTAAYSKQLDRLIYELHEEWEGPFQRFEFYLSRHFRPGAERCAAAVQCQDNFSQRIQQAANVLDAKIAIDTGIVVKLIALIGTVFAIVGALFNTAIVEPIRTGIVSAAIILAMFYVRIVFRDDINDVIRWFASDSLGLRKIAQNTKEVVLLWWRGQKEEEGHKAEETATNAEIQTTEKKLSVPLKTAQASLVDRI